MARDFVGQPSSEGETISSETAPERLLRYGSALDQVHKSRPGGSFGSPSALPAEGTARDASSPSAFDDYDILLSSHLPRLVEFEKSQAFRETRKRIVRRYSGVVEAVNDDIFRGRIQPANEDEEPVVADFVCDEISEDDLPLLRPGAWFYVSVEQESYPDGRRSTVSSLRFRRQKRWNQDEIDTARERGLKLAEVLGVDDTHRSSR